MRRRSLRVRIEERARGRCEYCQSPQHVCGYRFHLEHVIPVAAGGEDTDENRALSCVSCNLAKSDRITGIDPLTGNETPLFHPRTLLWHDHFAWNEDHRTLNGRTDIGRATIIALDMNSSLRQAARELWFTVGLLPQS